MSEREGILRTAGEKLGYQSLRPGQEEAIRALLEGRDTLAVMPTGSGKSAIYQIAGLLLPRPTVVVSPLIALQRDQLESIEEQGLAEAAAVNSTATEAEREKALEEMEEAELDFLFMAPEQFNNPETLERVQAAGPALFAVDEAHCISEWGHDFRPEYLRLGTVIDALGHPTVLALTATASPPVREEIMERLHMRRPQTVVRGFDRPNIWLGVQRFEDEKVKTEALLDAVVAAEKPGIVYVSTRKHAEEIAAALQDRGVGAIHYHAGLNKSERDGAHTQFMEDRAEAIVATNAFGLGVDKPNVRFVFHHDISHSVDAYYQEIGRAGRDGAPAKALLFYRPQDLGLHRFFAGGGKVDAGQVETAIEAVEQHDAPVDPAELGADTGLSRSKLATALTRLEEVGAIESLPTGEVIEAEQPANVHELAEEAVEHDERQRRIEQSRIEMMRGYAELWDCRREYLLNYFGEEFDDPCGRCDNCDAGRTVAQDEEDMPFPLNARVVHSVWGDGLVQRYESDKMVVLFDEVGYKTLLVDFVTQTGALRLAG